MRYRKKPVEVEAVQFNGWNFFPDIAEFCPSAYIKPGTVNDVYISTLEGEMRVLPGDFVIKGVAGEYYPCKGDIFWHTYEEVSA